MTREILIALLRDVYAAYGKSAPSTTSAIFSSIEERSSHIPDAAAPWLRDKMSDLDSLPVNVGKALGLWHQRWTEQNPSGKRPDGCPHCDGGWIRFFSAAQPFGFLVRCTCAGGEAQNIARIEETPGVSRMPAHPVDARGRSLPPVVWAVRKGLLRAPSSPGDFDMQKAVGAR